MTSRLHQVLDAFLPSWIRILHPNHTVQIEDKLCSLLGTACERMYSMSSVVRCGLTAAIKHCKLRAQHPQLPFKAATHTPGRHGREANCTKTQRRGQLWLRGKPASRYREVVVRFPWSSCWSVLWQDTEPQTAPDVLVGTLHGSHRHECMNVCMNYCKSLWTRASAKCPKCECK